MRRVLVILMVCTALGGSVRMSGADEARPAAGPVENLTLEQAFEMAEGRQPQIAEAKAMIEAAEGRARQAGAFPNPEAIVGAQQVPLSGNAPNEKEFVAGIGQTIPLGRRLSKAQKAELLDREVRERGLETKRRDLRRRVHSAFATALYQQQACLAQAEVQRHASKAVAITQARVEAGDALREDLARVEMERVRVEAELKRTESLQQQALVALGSAMGDATLPLKSLAGTLDATFEIPTLEALVANLSSQPESQQAEADIRAWNARIDLAGAERIPDVKVELLYHRLESSRENTFDLGLSIPLPLFNRNQGRLREARAEAAAAEARARLTKNELAARMRAAHLQLTAALTHCRTFKTEILPRAETVRAASEARYAAGDVSLAEVLPVRRDWAAVQLGYLESLRDAMQAWAELKPFADTR